MINRVDLQKLIDNVLNQERTTREKPAKQTETEAVKVELSQLAKSREQGDLKELEKKIHEIQSKLERGEYQVDPEKIFEGLSKFLSISER
ncbi:flagellar biosynthesis anti-sigma factor FlgM [Thermocrinis sp.]